MADPDSDTPAASATRPSPTEIRLVCTAVTEVGCQWPSRRRPRRLASGGRKPEADLECKGGPLEVAEESGSRVWARPRAACSCHLTHCRRGLSHWRARHTQAGRARVSPYLAYRNRDTGNRLGASSRAKSRGSKSGCHRDSLSLRVRMPPQPSRSSQFSASERTLLSAVQSGIRHGARSGGPIPSQTAPGSATLRDWRCDVSQCDGR
jgi:hypothetical protein